MPEGPPEPPCLMTLIPWREIGLGTLLSLQSYPHAANRQSETESRERRAVSILAAVAARAVEVPCEREHPCSNASTSSFLNSSYHKGSVPDRRTWLGLWLNWVGRVGIWLSVQRERSVEPRNVSGRPDLSTAACWLAPLVVHRRAGVELTACRAYDQAAVLRPSCLLPSVVQTWHSESYPDSGSTSRQFS